jgi:hypothetical protein
MKNLPSPSCSFQFDWQTPTQFPEKVKPLLIGYKKTEGNEFLSQTRIYGRDLIGVTTTTENGGCPQPPL